MAAHQHLTSSFSSLLLPRCPQQTFCNTASVRCIGFLSFSYCTNGIIKNYRVCRCRCRSLSSLVSHLQNERRSFPTNPKIKNSNETLMESQHSETNRFGEPKEMHSSTGLSSHKDQAIGMLLPQVSSLEDSVPTNNLLGDLELE